MWVPVNSQIQQTIPFKISSTQLYLQDDAINLDEITELDNASVFKLESQPLRTYEKDYNV